jgi:carbamoyl-phosphate synthase large subunit
MEEAVEVSQQRPVLIDRYLEDAVEVDVDCIADGETALIGAIMEHVELAGVHSGDSACMIPAQSLSEATKDKIREYTQAFARELGVCGLMNIQYAIQDEVVYVLEVNPRASRTVPFVSKAIGVPLAKLAALAMAGHKLADMGFTEEVVPKHLSVKEAVFPFVRFPGIDVLLSPEMKSTGEVMGIDSTFGMAFLKSQVAAGNALPTAGNVFVSVRDADKERFVPLASELRELGYTLYATRGTSTVLRDNGIESRAIFKISEGRPSALDMIEAKQLGWIVNTTSSGPRPRLDEVKMRAHAVIRGIPITTTIDGLRAAIDGLKALREDAQITVCSLQEYHRHAPLITLAGRS